MIHFDRFRLDNGLTVLFHKDETTPMVVVNTLYDVGARDENPERTGFAHLFEHLMFGGSVNIPNFDGPLQRAGGQNNAFTSNDITNYYNVLPAQNLETALWLESDRMLSLAFTTKSLEVQRSVVIEEFKQRYLNQPYGDVWLELRPLAYKKHPYQWATIGKNIEQIETATMEEVKAFFNTFYTPQNAILCIAGNVELDNVKELVEKWYGGIPAGKAYKRALPQEPIQNEFRVKHLKRKVPNNAFYYAFKMPGKDQVGYYEADLISDLLGRGKSSRLYRKLKKESELVTEINAFIMGSHDTGLLVISGFLNDNIGFDALDTALWEVLDAFKDKMVSDKELTKTINQVKTTQVFSEEGVLAKAMLLCANEVLGDANKINTTLQNYEQVTPERIHASATEILDKKQCSRLTIEAIK